MFLVCSAFALFSFAPAKKKKVIFFGDSITQAGVGPEGYITQMKSILPSDGYELIGAGIGGNKVYDLYLRMEDDVLNKQPDIVVIYIGVNDVWHKSTHGTGTDLDKFEKFYRALIKKIQANNAKVVLCTPAVIGEKKDGDNAQDADLNKFSDVIRKISEDTKLPLCDLRKLFMDYNLRHNTENNEKGILTSDRVHLNKEGNALVAKSLSDIIAKL
ncbi:Lysophospholipase L1 [Chitinophaga niabensis]|uniref:Lysophospholipase L1 n=2 Tax=Chitinophaga niabensis TaxID=536979 RepID=A0A1N6EI81_9BACT|nr:Lysophospholipase L1 [Chitinophaga niabensis]